MNARKQIDSWNADMKEHLVAMSEATSRGANSRGFREFTKVRVAHWEAL
jgi:hypothetical protein